MVDHSLLEKTLAQIKKKYGDDSAQYASEEPEDIARIPTGIIQLDAVMGGGFPLGRWSHMYGPYSSGKSLIALHLIKNAQSLGYNCAYYDLEKAFSKKWATSVGVDTDSLVVINGSVIEETAVKIEGLLGAINLHVIDSIGAGVSVDELASKPDEWRMGISARAWGKFLRRVNKFMSKEENSIVLINQTREVFGKNREEPTGGRAINYYSSINIHVNRQRWLYKDDKGNLTTEFVRDDSMFDDYQKAGVEILANIDKSKIHDPQGSARFRLEFGTGGQFDEVWGLVRSAIFNEVVKRAGSWFTLPDGTKVQGESALRVAIETNPELADLAREAMLQ